LFEAGSRGGGLQGGLGPLLLWFGRVLHAVHGGRRSRKEEKKRERIEKKKGRKKEKENFPNLEIFGKNKR
jgi:hypothetical protein